MTSYLFLFCLLLFFHPAFVTHNLSSTFDIRKALFTQRGQILTKQSYLSVFSNSCIFDLRSALLYVYCILPPCSSTFVVLCVLLSSQKPCCFYFFLSYSINVLLLLQCLSFVLYLCLLKPPVETSHSRFRQARQQLISFTSVQLFLFKFSFLLFRNEKHKCFI